MMPAFLRLFPVLFALALAGCASWLGSGDPGEHPTIYSPSPQIALDGNRPAHEASVLIAAPSAAPMLDSPRIVIRLAGDELQFLRGTRWSRSAPELLQDALLHVLEDSGKVQVARQDSGLAADWLLVMDIRHFEADYTQGPVPVIHIMVSAKLLNRQDKRIIAAQIFSHSGAIQASSTEAIISAFTEGLSQITLKLAEWILKAPLPSGEGLG